MEMKYGEKHIENAPARGKVLSGRRSKGYRSVSG